MGVYQISVCQMSADKRFKIINFRCQSSDRRRCKVMNLFPISKE